MSKQPCVYILASRRNGTVYIGVTSDLHARLYKHRSGMTRGFASEYRAYRLVHFEMFDEMREAIAREKRLKNWRREWKVALIEGQNSLWSDRALELGFEPVEAHPATREPGKRVAGDDEP